MDPTVTPCFGAQAADLLHVSHFGPPGSIYCANHDPLFLCAGCMGPPGGTHGPNRDPFFCAQAADLLHVSHFGVPGSIH